MQFVGLSGKLMNEFRLLVSVTRMACSHEHGECGHSNPGDGAGDKYSLYLKIDTEKVKCLNESIEGSGKLVFKAWDDRLDKEKVVQHLFYKQPIRIGGGDNVTQLESYWSIRESVGSVVL